MNQKLKATSLGLLAMLAVGALSFGTANATTSGHFVSDVSHAVIELTEENSHQVVFSIDGTPYICEETAYGGTLSAATATSLTVTPTYDQCKTEKGTAGEIVANVNGCDYVFSSNSKASTHTPTEHATLVLQCPAGKAIVLKHPNCEITMPPQSFKGVTFTTTVDPVSQKHELTVNTTISGSTTNFHAGACIFLGTSHQGAMNGSTTLRATNTAGERVNLTAT